MDKLKKKEVPEEKNSLSLTSIASRLKNNAEETVPVAETKKEETEKPETPQIKDDIKPVSRESKRANDVIKNTKFDEILEEIENRDYECSGVIYIDEEIKEVLSLLKSKGKIKTSSLVSYILERFLEENRDDINAIIKSSNRFL